MATDAQKEQGSEVRKALAQEFLDRFPTVEERKAEVLRKYEAREPVSDIEVWLADEGPAGELELTDIDWGGDNEPSVLTFVATRDAGTVTFRCALDDGRPRWSMTFDPADGALSARMLAEVGVPDLLDQAAAEMRRPSNMWGLPPEWLELNLAAKRTRSTPDQVYAVWTALYEKALARDPRRPIQVLRQWRPDYSESAIRAYLHTATARGLKEEAPSGKAGGGLTKKGRKALLGVPPTELEVPDGEH